MKTIYRVQYEKITLYFRLRVIIMLCYFIKAFWNHILNKTPFSRYNQIRNRVGCECKKSYSYPTLPSHGKLQPAWCEARWHLCKTSSPGQNGGLHICTATTLFKSFGGFRCIWLMALYILPSSMWRKVWSNRGKWSKISSHRAKH